MSHRGQKMPKKWSPLILLIQYSTDIYINLDIIKLGCVHGRPQTFFQGRARFTRGVCAKTYYLPEKCLETYYFLSKKMKNILF